MFIDMSIKFSQSELGECQKLLAYLSKQPSVKMQIEADKAIEEAHDQVLKATEPTKVEPQATPANATPAEPQPKPKAEKTYTHDEVKQACKKLVDEKGSEVLGQVLKQLGHRKLSEVPEADWPKLMEAVNAR